MITMQTYHIHGTLMKRTRIPALAAALLVAACAARAQEASVYASVLATKLFVVGAANPLTGLFFKHTGSDTLWNHAGAKNIRVFGVAFGPGSGGRVIYLAAGNGVHLSRDRGLTWKITTDWRITEVMCVAPDPADTSTVYCTCPYGVFKTTDGCRTWDEMNGGLTSLYTESLVISGKKLYAVTQDGLFASTDGARHWKRMGLSVGGTRTLAIDPRDPSFMIAGTEDYGLYVSHDGGDVWARSESGVDHMTFYAVTFDPVDPSVIYAGGYVTGVYKSTDGANTWKRSCEGLTVQNVHAIAVDPTRHDRVYAATLWGGVYVSVDGGATWKGAGLTGSQVWSIVTTTF